MMKRGILAILALVAAVGLSACSSKFKTYDGPEVTEVFVFKSQRKMYLMHHDKAIATYDIDLGFAPEGHKTQKGDGRTPEGSYYIDRRNPDSAYHLSIGISYPNPADRESAKAAGVNPGGDIFIHGGPTRAEDRGKPDWTAGCIAISNKEIEDVYAMVRDGTPIHIFPVSTPGPAIAKDEGEAATIVAARAAARPTGVEAIDDDATEPALATEVAFLDEDIEILDEPLAADITASRAPVIGGEVDLVGEGDPVE